MKVGGVKCEIIRDIANQRLVMYLFDERYVYKADGTYEVRDRDKVTDKIEPFLGLNYESEYPFVAAVIEMARRSPMYTDLFQQKDDGSASVAKSEHIKDLRMYIGDLRGKK